MGTEADYCELCDLAFSQCVHGRPPPPPPAPTPKVKPAPRVRVSRVATRSTSAGPAEPAKPVRRRWSPPDLFRPHIVALLQDAGGELQGDDVFEELEVRVGEELLDGDREAMPQGELRWRFAARKARKALIDDGLLAPAAGPGVWRLTSAGREIRLSPED